MRLPIASKASSTTELISLHRSPEAYGLWGGAREHKLGYTVSRDRHTRGHSWSMSLGVNACIPALIWRVPTSRCERRRGVCRILGYTPHKRRDRGTGLFSGQGLIARYAHTFPGPDGKPQYLDGSLVAAGLPVLLVLLGVFWLWAGVDTIFITFGLMVATIVTLSSLRVGINPAMLA